MPQAADFTVNNGATPAVAKAFSLISPAAGDGSIAMWAIREGAISSVFPTLTAMARATGNNSRQLRVKLKLPSSFTDSVTGRTIVSSGAEMNVTFSIPGDFPESLKNDFVAFSLNTLSHASFKPAIRDALGFN